MAYLVHCPVGLIIMRRMMGLVVVGRVMRVVMVFIEVDNAVIER